MTCNRATEGQFLIEKKDRQQSCVGCKFLYSESTGYSNYTWNDNDIKCAKDKNPNLPAEKCGDWTPQRDNWSKTDTSRCELYSPGEMVTLDVEGEDGPGNYTKDEEAIAAICAHSSRERHRK